MRADGGSSPCVGGALASFDLRTRFSKLDAFTVEYFFKLDASYVWRNWFAIKFGDSLSVTDKMTFGAVYALKQVVVSPDAFAPQIPRPSPSRSGAWQRNGNLLRRGRRRGW